MRKKYPGPSNEREIKRALAEMGVDILEPESRSEEGVARALEEFSLFVLRLERDACLEILEGDLRRGGDSVGELQGGSDRHSIYRASFPADGVAKRDNAALRLLDRYNRQIGRDTELVLTIKKIKQYMLGMCSRRANERGCSRYTSLGNIMFIMQFGGPTEGQVRHIDNMLPNLQICLYMSPCCPSTVVYDVDDGDGLPVTDGASLVDFWEGRGRGVPDPVKDILLRHGGRELRGEWHTKYFAWDTIDSQLSCFGRLYQPVARQLGLRTRPGTALLAGGNEIHAGPPTTGPRMFAFAIGIPEGDARRPHEDLADSENDGEVQYSPVLFHLDLCCLLFGMLDYEYESACGEGLVREAKKFLVEVLLEMIVEYPMKEYLLQIDSDRVGVRTWFETILTLLENGQSTNVSTEEAVTSDKIFYSPDVIKRRLKKKRRRPKSNKKLH